MIASYKFIQKLWLLHKKIKKSIGQNIKEETDEISKYTNQLINKINNNLERFNYNVIIANMYETYNFLVKKIGNKTDSQNLKENYIKILTIMSPIIPHFASECLEDFGIDFEQKWPGVEKKFLEDDKINLVIQINGKKKTILNTHKNISEKELLDIIKNTESIKKIISNKKIQKSFFVKNRLINILIND